MGGRVRTARVGEALLQPGDKAGSIQHAVSVRAPADDQPAGSQSRCPQSKKKEFLALAVWSSKQISARHSGVGKETASQSQLAILKSLMGDLEIRD